MFGAAFDVTIRCDAPVDVVEFECVSNLRTQVQITVSAAGASAFRTSDRASPATSRTPSARPVNGCLRYRPATRSPTCSGAFKGFGMGNWRTARARSGAQFAGPGFRLVPVRNRGASSDVSFSPGSLVAARLALPQNYR
jgi:hypothetical protein